MLAVRERAAPRDPGGLRRARLPARDRRGGRGGRRSAHASRRPARPRPRRRRRRPPTACSTTASPPLDVALALDRRGFRDVAERHRRMQRQRVSADYLQTVGDDRRRRGACTSAVNDPNDYRGPGTGYRLEGERWAQLQALPHEVDPARVGLRRRRPTGPAGCCATSAPAQRGARGRRGGRRASARPSARSCARRSAASRTRTCCAQLCAGIAEGGARAAARAHRAHLRRRVHRPRRRAAWPAPASRSACSRRARRSSTAPTCSRSTTSSCSAWRRCLTPRLLPPDRPQRRALRATARSVGPVPLVLDNFARAKLIVRTDAPAPPRDRGDRARRAGGGRHAALRTSEAVVGARRHARAAGLGASTCTAGAVRRTSSPGRTSGRPS